LNSNGDTAQRTAEWWGTKQSRREIGPASSSRVASLDPSNCVDKSPDQVIDHEVHYKIHPDKRLYRRNEIASSFTPETLDNVRVAQVIDKLLAHSVAPSKQYQESFRWDIKRADPDVYARLLRMQNKKEQNRGIDFTLCRQVRDRCRELLHTLGTSNGHANAYLSPSTYHH
jgi:hypothetical protein